MSSQLREFCLSDVLSVVPGRLVSDRHIDGVYDLLNYMTGESLFTHQLPRASRQCEPFLIRQYPQLAQADTARLDQMMNAVPVGGDRAAACRAWVESEAARLGLLMRLTVKPLPPGENGPRDPVQELEQMVGKDRVLVVSFPETSQQP